MQHGTKATSEKLDSNNTKINNILLLPYNQAVEINTFISIRKSKQNGMCTKKESYRLMAVAVAKDFDVSREEFWKWLLKVNRTLSELLP